MPDAADLHEVAINALGATVRTEECDGMYRYVRCHPREPRYVQYGGDVLRDSLVGVEGSSEASSEASVASTVSLPVLWDISRVSSEASSEAPSEASVV